MLKQAISYTYIPALVTLLCACPAEAVNFHIGFDFPIACRPLQPIGPLYTVPVYRVYDVPRVQTRHSAVDARVKEIQYDLNNIHVALHDMHVVDLCNLSRIVKNSWFSWITKQMSVYGINSRNLETMADSVHDIRFELKRIQRERRGWLEHELNQLRTVMTDLVDIIESYRCRTSDIRDVILSFSEIQRILARV